jgi:hypothetical protein
MTRIARGCERSDRSLRSRRSTINMDCAEWSGVDKMNPSGTGDRDKVIVLFSLLSIYFILFHVHT